jgi:hypothetical protein
MFSNSCVSRSYRAAQDVHVAVRGGDQVVDALAPEDDVDLAEVRAVGHDLEEHFGGAFGQVFLLRVFFLVLALLVVEELGGGRGEDFALAVGLRVRLLGVDVEVDLSDDQEEDC